MAIMRTNRLTSKTTPPDKTQTTKGVTVSRKVSPTGLSVTPSGEIKARNATLTDAKWSAEQSNKEYADAIKSGKYVSINDPSVDPTTRKLVMGSMTSAKDAYGTREDFAIPKGYKVSSYKEMYGTDYNPEEMRAANKSGKLDQYVKEKGYKDGQGFSPNYTEYTKYAGKKEEKSPELTKITTLPAVKKLTPSGKLKERTPEKPEPPSFESPGVQKKGKASTGGTSVSMNPFAKGATTKGAAGRYVKQVVQSVGKTGGKSKDMMGYNRQEKLFKAYAGTSVLGESHIGKSAQDLNAYKKEYKSQRKEYRREGNLEGVAATSMEVKQARQAEKFVKGKQTHFNDKNYQNTTGKTSRIAPDYRNSAENAANRNTMQAKLNAISAKPKNNTSMY